jgi:hypothetical protein
VSERLRWGVRLKRVAWHALPILALAVSAAPCLAQTLVCHPIRRGESAGQAARRVAGDSRKLYSTAFQIMNDASRFVPKSQYDRLRAGWRACIVKPSARSTVSPGRRPDPAAVVAVAERDVTAAPPIAVAPTEPVVRFRVSAQSGASVSPRPRANAYLTIVWLGAALAVPWFGFEILNGYVTRRKAALVPVQHFAHRFIAEFERPLLRYDDTDPPLKARVRHARRGRFDILLAPGQGRRYPNLTDHKRNVEYDVGRVLSALDDPAFVHGDLYAHDDWVVVPFEPMTGPKPSGITCISSS